MSQQVITGQTDWSIRLWCYDAAGAAVTGLLHNSAGMAVSVVVRSKGRILSMTALTLVARSSVGVHRDSAWTEVSDGEYVVDLPDSYLATAERTVSLTVAATAITGTVIVETIEVGRGVELDSSSLRSALGMSAADLDAQLDAILAAASAGAGTGARTVTITVNDGTTALQNAVVRLTEGSNTFRALTNASGVATFNLDDATYTVAVTKSGYTYAGTTLVVDGTETATYSMTAVSVTPPTNPDLSAIEVLCLDEDFAAASGIDVDFRMASVAAGDQNRAHPGAKKTVTSNGSGIARFEGPQGATIEWKRGTGQQWTPVTLDNDSVTNVTSLIGSP